MDPGLYFRAGSRKKREVVAPIARAAFPALVEKSGEPTSSALILRRNKVALRGSPGERAAVSAAARAPWGVRRPFRANAPRRKASKALRTPKIENIRGGLGDEVERGEKVARRRRRRPPDPR